MSAEAFFDTNLVVYAFIQTDSRSNAADRLLAAGGTISIQVMNEFVNVARRKHALTWPQIETSLQALRRLCGDPRPLTLSTHEAGVRIAARYGYRIYDALIIASAAESGCRTLYSEDLANGQTIEGVRIVNPFV